MTDSERTLRRIEALLTIIAAKMGAALPVKPKSAASVASITRSADGTVVNDDSDAVPRQVVGDIRRVGPMGRARRVTRIRDRQGDPR